MAKRKRKSHVKTNQPAIQPRPGRRKPDLSHLPEAPFPGDIKPMLATLTDKPFNSKEWIYEIKWDGYRAVSKIKNGNVDIISRNLISFNEKFGVIKELLKKQKYNMVIDGEIIALDDENKPSFQHLQNFQRTGIGNLAYYVFDILWLEGYNTEGLPVLERKALLQQVLNETGNIFYCEHIEENGNELFKQIRQLGMEGIIAKKSDSKYYEDTRSKSWLKIKTVNTMDAVICGFTEPRGSRKYFGALVLAVYEKGKLQYIGHTGTGFNFSNQKSIYNLLLKHVSKSSPFDSSPKTNMPVTWLKPDLVCEIKYTHLTDENILRHPVFLRMRDDKKPKEVTLSTQVKK